MIAWVTFRNYEAFFHLKQMISGRIDSLGLLWEKSGCRDELQQSQLHPTSALCSCGVLSLFHFSRESSVLFPQRWEKWERLYKSRHLPQKFAKINCVFLKKVDEFSLQVYFPREDLSVEHTWSKTVVRPQGPFHNGAGSPTKSSRPIHLQRGVGGTEASLASREMGMWAGGGEVTYR